MRLMINAFIASQYGQLIALDKWINLGFGLLAIIGVSLIGFFAAGIMVCLKYIANQACFDIIIRFFFTLACGALVGDAMIHILPEAYGTDGAIQWIVALIFLAAILFALLLQKLFHTLGIAHSHWVNSGQHDSCEEGHEGHEHNHQKQQEKKDSSQKYKEEAKKQNLEEKAKKQNLEEKANNKVSIIQSNVSLDNMIDSTLKLQAEKKSDSSSEDPEDKGCCSWTGKGTSGYLNLIGSFIHNFIDGLALGVAFATGRRTEFVPLLIAIIAHEIPRQLGDVAILMKSKFSSLQTICCNGVVNLVSIIGGIIGLAVSNLDNVAQMYILAFVAGSFVYIAADIWRNMFKNKGCFKNIVELLGFILGCLIMFLLLLLQSDKHGDE